ncbi:TniQ family protein [Embleya sp. NPDC005575]|uniref:TniQ family protein n=1 Tax=Embleya sp. NPDC005575 TaxID=3156892 RepID=UPI00339DB38D
MAPLAHESTASWVGRVAATYRQSAPELLDGIGITTTGAGMRGAHDGGTTEIHLDPPARRRLAAFTRVPHHHLRRALPHLERPRDGYPARTPDAIGAIGSGIASWHRLDSREQPSRACPWCTLRHTAGTTARARVHLPAHRVWCPRHACWSTGGPRPRLLDTGGVPELAHTHREHRKLLRRPNANTAYTWAQAIVTRWYDHELYPTGRWQARGHRLAVVNPDWTATQGSSWELTARPVIIHPETITLARVLAHTRLPATPRPDRHPAVTGFLGHTAHTLGLGRLAPSPEDLLWSWTRHHTRPRKSPPRADPPDQFPGPPPAQQDRQPPTASPRRPSERTRGQD